MKLTKQQLKQIIKEEISKVLVEYGVPMGAPASVPWEYSQAFIDDQIDIANGIGLNRKEVKKGPWDPRVWYDEFLGGKIEPTEEDRRRLELAIQRAKDSWSDEYPGYQIEQAYKDLAKHYGEAVKKPNTEITKNENHKETI